MTGIALFTEGGVAVVANCPVTPHDHPSNFRDMYVGVEHQVWGWQAALDKAQARAAR